MAETVTLKPISAEIKRNDYIQHLGDPSLVSASDGQIVDNILKKFAPAIGKLEARQDSDRISLYWYPPAFNPEAEKFNREALNHARQKDFPAAIQLWHEAIRLNPQDPNYHFNLGVASYEKGDYDNARQNLEQTLAICPIYARAYFLLGTILSRERRYREAVEIIQKGHVFNPANPNSLVNLGAIASILKDYDGAIRHFEKAISLNAKETKAYFGLAKIYSAKNDIDNANRCYRAVIKLDPNGKMANIARQSIIADPISVPDSPDTVDEFSNYSPEELYSEGYRAYVAGNYSRAVAAYSRYLKTSPSDADVWSSLAAAQIRVGKVDDAIQSLKRAIMQNSKKSLFHKQIAIAYDLTHRHEEAVISARQAQALGKTDSITLGILGKNLSLLNRHAEAIPILQNAVKANQNNFSARYFLAVSLSRSGQIDVAQDHLQEILFSRIDTPIKESARQLIQALRNPQTV